MSMVQSGAAGYGFNLATLRDEVLHLISVVGAADVVFRARDESARDGSPGQFPSISQIPDAVIETNIKAALLRCAVMHRAMYDAEDRRALYNWYDQNAFGTVVVNQKKIGLSLIDGFNKIIHAKEIKFLQSNRKISKNYSVGQISDIDVRISGDVLSNSGSISWECTFAALQFAEASLRFIGNMEVAATMSQDQIHEIRVSMRDLRKSIREEFGADVAQALSKPMRTNA